MFHHFKTLPAELRIQIWTFAAEEALRECRYHLVVAPDLRIHDRSLQNATHASHGEARTKIFLHLLSKGRALCRDACHCTYRSVVLLPTKLLKQTTAEMLSLLETCLDARQCTLKLLGSSSVPLGGGGRLWIAESLLPVRIHGVSVQYSVPRAEQPEWMRHEWNNADELDGVDKHSILKLENAEWAALLQAISPMSDTFEDTADPSIYARRLANDIDLRYGDRAHCFRWGPNDCLGSVSHRPDFVTTMYMVERRHQTVPERQETES